MSKPLYSSQFLVNTSILQIFSQGSDLKFLLKIILLPGSAKVAVVKIIQYSLANKKPVYEQLRPQEDL